MRAAQLRPSPAAAAWSAKALSPNSQVLKTNGHELISGQPGFVLVPRASFIQKQPAAAARLGSMTQRAIDLIAADPSQAVDDIFKYFGKGLIHREIISGRYSRQIPRR